MNKFSANSRKYTKTKSSDEEIDLNGIIQKYVHYWKWFVLSAFVFVLLGVFAYLIIDRKYDVRSAVLLREDKGPRSSTGGASALGSLKEIGLLSSTNNIDNEIAVFKSPNLLKQVIYDLELHVEYFEKDFFRNKDVYKESPYYVSMTEVDLESLRNTLYIEIEPRGNNEVYVKSEYTVLEEDYKVRESLKLPGVINFPGGLGKLFITHRPSASNENKDKSYAVAIYNPQKMAYSLAKELRVAATTKLSSVLEMSINTLNPVKAKDFLNTLVRIYNQNDVLDNNQISINTSEFIDKRIIGIMRELQQVETKEETYKKNKKIADVGTEAKVFIERTAEVEKNIINIETQQKIIEMVEAAINEPKYQTIPTMGIIDEGLVRIITEFNSQVLNYDRLQRSTTEDSPSRIDAYAQLENTRLSIKNSVNSVKQAIAISKGQVDKQMSKISSRIDDVPTQEKELLEIMRLQSVKQALYLHLMKVKEETSIAIASTSDKAKIITDPIIPEHPFSPRLRIIFLGSLLLGLIVPVLVILLKDLLQVNITSRSELEALANASVVGEIIKKEKDQDTIVVEKNSTTSIVELFRALRNNLQFIMKSTDKKCILVTSTISGEGKTFVSINLATSFSLLEDKKVLLIGADVRNPKLCADMGLKKGNGLTYFLSGGEPDWKSMLTKLDKFPNLFVLQAGVIPPNPNELLMNPAFKDLLKEARKEYDIIIIDSAPVGIISDTFLIGNLVDITLYVTREKVTPKKATEFINEIKAEEKLPNLYLVINGVEETSDQFGYGYGLEKG